MATLLRAPEPDFSPASLTSLASLPPEASGVVVAIQAGDALERRLLELGFAPGTPVRVVRRAPLGDPVAYELRGVQLCLRSAEARRIEVARLDRDPRP